LPSMINRTTEALKDLPLPEFEVRQTDSFERRQLLAVNEQWTESISLAAGSDNVNVASAPASKLKPIKVSLVPPDTGPRTG